MMYSHVLAMVPYATYIINRKLQPCSQLRSLSSAVRVHTYSAHYVRTCSAHYEKKAMPPRWCSHNRSEQEQVGIGNHVT